MEAEAPRELNIPTTAVRTTGRKRGKAARLEIRRSRARTCASPISRALRKRRRLGSMPSSQRTVKAAVAGRLVTLLCVRKPVARGSRPRTMRFQPWSRAMCARPRQTVRHLSRRATSARGGASNVSPISTVGHPIGQRATPSVRSAFLAHRTLTVQVSHPLARRLRTSACRASPTAIARATRPFAIQSAINVLNASVTMTASIRPTDTNAMSSSRISAAADCSAIVGKDGCARAARAVHPIVELRCAGHRIRSGAARPTSTLVGCARTTVLVIKVHAVTWATPARQEPTRATPGRRVCSIARARITRASPMSSAKHATTCTAAMWPPMAAARLSAQQGSAVPIA